MRITREFIMAGRSARGGWSQYQLSILGVHWPPKKGWVDRVTGKEITDAQAQSFTDYAGVRNGKKPQGL